MSIRSSLIGLFLIAAGPAQAELPLTQKQAELRVQQVSHPQYDLTLDVSGPAEFKGEATLTFEWNDKIAPKPLLLDFRKGRLLALNVNGHPEPFHYDETFLEIPAKAFKAGSNEIRITYTHPFSRDGSGLYRFVDPEDKRVYLYTQFETWDANQMFPSFDQPDLKATFKMKVTAPKEWVVVSTMRESKADELLDKKTWSFPATQPISPYVFSLTAGPYKVWEDAKFRIPLRVMARQSMARYVNVEEWLAWTRYGFDFYEKAFGTPYPFQKYDQVLVPDFNAGAMENVANVSYNERFAYRGERSAQAVTRNFDTLLHEMAHMWFGDLVTMKWWDDLWLNESFATYAAAWAMSDHPDFKDHAWIDFHNEKNWAYFADRLVTTHPITGEVPDTDAADARFDGITYGKGAAFLQLLAFRLGQESFAKGLARYFKDHAYGNTTLSDLLSELDTSGRGELQAFAKPWLTTAGLNTVSVAKQCNAQGELESLTLTQGAPAKLPDLRQHSMLISLYKDRDGADVWAPYETLRADYAGASTQLTLPKKLPCPTLIAPNSGDEDYVKVLWSEADFKAFKTELPRIASPMQRLLFWESLGWSLEDGEIGLDEVLPLLAAEMPLETDNGVLNSIDTLIEYHILKHVKSFPDRARRITIAKQLISPLQTILIDAKRPKDNRIIAFNLLIPVLGLSEDKTALTRIYQKQTSWPDFELDQPRRWEVLGELAALRDEHAKTWAKAERDRSNAGLIAQRSIEASLASPKEKEKIVASLLKNPDKLPMKQVLATVTALYPPQQIEARLATRKSFLKNLHALAAQKDDTLKPMMLDALLPAACSADDDALFTAIFKEKWTYSVVQDVLERQDALRHCRIIREHTAAQRT